MDGIWNELPEGVYQMGYRITSEYFNDFYYFFALVQPVDGKYIYSIHGNGGHFDGRHSPQAYETLDEACMLAEKELNDYLSNLSIGELDGIHKYVKKHVNASKSNGKKLSKSNEWTMNELINIYKNDYDFDEIISTSRTYDEYIEMMKDFITEEIDDMCDEADSKLNDYLSWIIITILDGFDIDEIVNRISLTESAWEKERERY